MYTRALRLSFFSRFFFFTLEKFPPTKMYCRRRRRREYAAAVAAAHFTLQLWTGYAPLPLYCIFHLLSARSHTYTWWGRRGSEKRSKKGGSTHTHLHTRKIEARARLVHVSIGIVFFLLFSNKSNFRAPLPPHVYTHNCTLEFKNGKSFTAA